MRRWNPAAPYPTRPSVSLHSGGKRNPLVSAASASQETQSSPLSVLPRFSFPGVPSALQEFMEGLMLQVEGAIGDQLLPSNTPSDVTSFAAPQGSKGFIQLFPGKDRRKVRGCACGLMRAPQCSELCPLMVLSTVQGQCLLLAPFAVPAPRRHSVARFLPC